MLGLLAALYRVVLRPILFWMDAERAHALGAAFLRLLHCSKSLRAVVGSGETLGDTALAVEALGLRFRSPIGVAAGFDKDARFFRGLGALGFGFVEVGTVTARAQPGNPRPRLFRLPADRALVNRMGFNNAGAGAIAARLARLSPASDPTGLVVAANIGKSRAAALEDAPEDYAASARLLAPHVHFLVANVSSPNTPGLRALQALAPLRAVLAAVQRELAAIAGDAGSRRLPLLVKIAPDLTTDEIDAIADLARELRLDGIVATNTTTAREALRSPPDLVARAGEGGLSGEPLRERSLAVLRRLRARAGPDLVLIAAGGIARADDAWAAIRAGATLVEVYTAFVYEGPAIARDIARGLRNRLRDAGLDRIDRVIGLDAGGS